MSVYFKNAGGNEGDICKYPVRLDTYGCGCQHDCSYCYAKSLLSFRGLWNPEKPQESDLGEIANVVKKLPAGSVVRLGGMTDCFMPMEKQRRITFRTIEMLNKRRVHYLIVTKSHIVADPEYLEILDKHLAHIQITITTLDDELAPTYEKASLPSKRIEALKTLQNAGYDVAIRLSPIIPELLNMGGLRALEAQKTVVEFLRVNSWIKQWFPMVDYKPYKLKQGGYRFLRLDDKKRIIEQIKIPEVSVCEDYLPHYKYWQVNVNPNRDDCYNLNFKT